MERIPEERAAELFKDALEQPEEARKAWLDAACRDDAALRAEVDALLAADRAAEGFLEPVTRGSRRANLPDLAAATLVGKRLGRYRIERMLGSGGMGTVYLATQDRPRRLVALKVVKPGFVSRDALRRFEHESEILARLRHPGIAQVFEAGTARLGDEEDGIPYFAMEYIPGARSILEYAGEKRLGHREKLELFARVCDAVNHGHQNAIIHRDLKPSNILVDESGQPKVIDFGIARVTDRSLTVATLETGAGQIFGTLRYMSPEQCDADPRRIDTRSDVYALGVVLFELMTDRLPYDLSTSSIVEAARIIREEAPFRPSALQPSLRGDVETIILEAIEKERDRRYSSAADLAADIRRYLRHEPIAAHPPSPAYRLRKFARRNRTLASGVVTVFIVLVLGIVGVSRALVRAEREAAKNAAVNRFLSGIFELVHQETVRHQDTVLLRGLLRDATAMAEEDLADEPAVKADIHETIGKAYQNLGLPEEARSHLEIALKMREELHGRNHADAARSLSQLGVLMLDLYDPVAAERYLRESLTLRRRLLGRDHVEIAGNLVDLARALQGRRAFPEAERLFQEGIAMYRRLLGNEDPRLAKSLEYLALLKYGEDDYASAEPLYREALGIYRKRPRGREADIASTLTNLGKLLDTKADADAAETSFREALDIYRAFLGDDHPCVAWSEHRLGIALGSAGDAEAAESAIRRALATFRRLGDDSLDVASCLESLGIVLAEKGEFDAAEAAFREALSIRRKHGGEGSQAMLALTGQYARCLWRAGRAEEAEPYARVASEGFQEILHPPVIDRLKAMDTLAVIRRDLGRFDEAETLFLEMEAICNASPPQNPRIAPEIRLHHGELLLQAQRPDEAEPLLARSHEELEKVYGEAHRLTQEAAGSLLALQSIDPSPPMDAGSRK